MTCGTVRTTSVSKKEAISRIWLGEPHVGLYSNTYICIFRQAVLLYPRPGESMLSKGSASRYGGRRPQHVRTWKEGRGESVPGV